MLEIILIIGLGWFGVEQHERAVTAEVALSATQAENVQLQKVVKVWKDDNESLEEANRKYEDSIREIARENAQQKIDLNELRDDQSRDYIESPIPDNVLEWIRESGE